MQSAGTISDPQMKKLNVLLDQAGMTKREEALEWIGGVLGRSLDTRKDLSGDEASQLIDVLADGTVRRHIDDNPGKPTVHEAIAAVIRDIGRVGIGKTQDNVQQRYKFRGIDQFVDALSPILAKHGVITSPQVRNFTHEVHPTSSGGRQIMVILLVDWKIYGPRGDSISATTIGQAFDSGDKAANKAMSAAFKYLLGQLFVVPNIGWSEQDFDSPTVGTGYATTESSKPGLSADDSVGQQALVKRIAELAKDQGLSVDAFTKKFRETNGNITVEQMNNAPRDLLYGFVRRVEAYASAHSEPGTTA